MSQRFGSSGKSKRLAVVIAGLLILSVVGVALATSVSLDTFNDGPILSDGFTELLVHSGLQVASAANAAAGAVGGDHEVVLNWVAGTGQVARASINYFGNQRFSYSAGDGITAMATIRWDGSGGTAAANDCALPVTDLIDTTPVNDGFHLEVINDDLPANIGFHVYSGIGCANSSFYTLTLPGGILSPAHVDFFVPFNLFTGSADFSAVRAVEVVIDGTTTPGTDVSLDFIDADNFREYGDLPTAPYGATIVNTYQVPQGQRLGRNVDVEVASQPDVPAGTTTSGDDSATLPSVDDEDGVRPTPGQGPWLANGSGTIDVSYAGCLSNCYLNGWIDWNDDGDFADSGEQVFADTVLTTSSTQVTQTLNITVGPGASLASAQRYARFRICPTATTCDQVSGQNGVIGEIEDYRWTFGPLAVTLNSLEAKADAQNNTAALILAATVVAALGLAGVALRRRTA